MRAAIGASRGRLVRLFLTESLVLAIAGAVVGLLVAVLSVKALIAASPVKLPRADAISVDFPVLIFATVVAALTALAFGLVPAFIMSRAELQDALKDGSKGSVAQGQTMRSSLVVAEVALAVILLSGAGLLVRSVSRLLRVNTGVDPAFVITADMQLPDAAYREWERVEQFYTSLTRALSDRPGIVAAGTTTFLPLDPGWRLPFAVVGAAPVTGATSRWRRFIPPTPAILRRCAHRSSRGRTFEARDGIASLPVVIVNEMLAKRLWPNDDPIGKRIRTTIRQIGPLARRMVPGRRA